MLPWQAMVEHSKLDSITNLIVRYPRNVIHIIKRMPAILLSPIFLFALLLPEFLKINNFGRRRGDHLPLVIIFFFPLLFYPLIHIEPRFLFSILIPIHIWGAAGIVAISAYMYQMKKNIKILPAIVIICSCIMLLITIWRGYDLQKRSILYHSLASWIKTHIPSDQVLFGDGYGYISNTGFLIPNPISIRPWSEDVDKLTKSVKNKGGEWLIIYEGFLKEYNPELLIVLQKGVPDAKKMFETSDGYGTRSQIYKIIK